MGLRRRGFGPRWRCRARPDAADHVGGAGLGRPDGLERDGHHGARAPRRDRHHAGHRRGQWAGRGAVFERGGSGGRGLMLLITLAALASAGLTVWSVMATTVLERRGEIAIMQATGAGNGLVAALFSIEVALEGAAGGLIGSWVGLLMAEWVGRAVFQTSLEIPAMLGPVVVGAAVLASIAGAAQPLRRALLLEPAVTLRGGE